MAAIIMTGTLHCRMTIMPRAVLPSSDKKMRVPYELKQGQSRHFHKLPSGLNMEFIFQKGREKNVENYQQPPLVFVHGSFHAAWCWAEHWLPFFSQHGFDCYALSLLAQGESDSPSGVVAGSLQTHAADVADFIHKEIQYPPVLLGHSFGGLIVQYYIANVGHEKLQEMEHTHPNLAGAILVCSVPPSGNSGLVWRYLFSKPIAAFKILWGPCPFSLPDLSSQKLSYSDPTSHIPTRSCSDLRGIFYSTRTTCFSDLGPGGPPLRSRPGDWDLLRSEWLFLSSPRDRVTRSLAAKAFQTSLPLCKETFFSAAMEDHLVLRYQKLMTESSRMPLFDLRKLNASLPVPPMKDPSLKILVLGANDDFIVDAEGLNETGRFYGVPPVSVEGVAHDMMLDCSWEKGAQVILSWLPSLDR